MQHSRTNSIAYKLLLLLRGCRVCTRGLHDKDLSTGLEARRRSERCYAGCGVLSIEQLSPSPSCASSRHKQCIAALLYTKLSLHVYL